MPAKTKLFFIVFFPITILIFANFYFKKTHIQVIETYKTNWMSGRSGNKSGTDYYIKVKIMNNQKIEFDSLWFEDKGMPTFLSQITNDISDKPITFNKNDTVTVRVSYLNGSQTNLTKAPKNYKSEALLRYFVNGKKYYLSISKFKIEQIPNQQ
jgi:hypothetical protein